MQFPFLLTLASAVADYSHCKPAYSWIVRAR